MTALDNMMREIEQEIILVARRELEQVVLVYEDVLDEYLDEMIQSSAYLKDFIFQRVTERLDYEALAKEV